jgi:3-oxoadipate enol-lactonase
MQYVVVDGVRLAVEISGPPGGLPLILLHGGGSGRSTWDGVLPDLAKDRLVWAMDQRGFGDSDRPGAYGFERMRDDVLGLADQLGADRFDLVGHSMGGTVAWLVAQKQPERVAHLVVVDSPPPKAGVERIKLGERPETELPYDWAARVAIINDFNSPDPAWWDRMDAVTARTLVLAGGEISHVPQELLRQAADAVPGTRLTEIPVGHNIHLEAPEAFVAEVLAFLAIE